LQVQRWADGRFNRTWYDADRIVAVFSAQLEDIVYLDSVRDNLAGIANQALRPTHVSIWINGRR
jgi:hypothetical protein